MPHPRCSCCRSPSPRQHRRRLRAEIHRRGWLVQTVDRCAAPYAYTVGLTVAHLPELVVHHRHVEAETDLLDALASRLLDGEQVDEGGEVRGLLTGGLPARLHDVTHPRPPVHVASVLYGEVVARQLVLPDDRGHFPYEDGYLGDPVPLLFATPTTWPFPAAAGSGRTR